MSTTSTKSKPFPTRAIRRWLLPARRALACSLLFLLLTQAIIPPALVYSRASSARPSQSSGVRPKTHNTSGAVAPPLTATAATNAFGIVLTPLTTAFNGHAGIDYHAQSGSLVVSANSPAGLPNNFELIDGGGTHRTFSNVGGLGGALKIATARDEGQGVSLAGFSKGEMFAGAQGAVARISADGRTVQNSWAALPGEPGLIGGLHLDRTGVFGGDLFVVTDAGGVWRINAAAVASQVASLNTPLAGVTTIPDDPAKYGPWAGKILAGAKTRGVVYAIDAQGSATSYPLGINPEEIEIVPAHENFFGLDPADGKLWGAQADAFAGLIGDVLVGQRSPGILMRVRWNGTEFETGQLAQVAQWSQITFAPAGVAEIRGVKQLYDKLAVVRHAPVLNSGRIEGALWQLSAENVALGGTDTITSDLLVPGTPTVNAVGGQANFGGVIAGDEDSQPTGYTVNIGANASLRHLITRTNPFEMGQVAAPPAPSGTRDVSISKEGESVGDFSTLRNMSLSGRAGAVSVPPGTYGNFAVSGRTSLVLGVENASEPAVYNLQGLTLTGGSELRLAGPVVLTVRGEVSLTGSTVGAADNPRRLRLKVAEAGVKAGGGGVLYGIVSAPRGEVEITGQARIRGTVMCDRLTVSGKGILQVTENDVPPPPVNRPPAVEAGANQVVTLPSDTVSLNGTAGDDGLPRGSALSVTWSVVSGPGTVSFGNPATVGTTATFVEAGTYVLKLTASDGMLTASDEMHVEIVPRNQPPTVNAGADITIKLPESVKLNGTVSDDALPRGSHVSVEWSLGSGPAAPVFTDASAAATNVSFTAPGIYTLKLSASDTEFTVSDELVVTVNPANQPPTADAGPDQSITLNESLPAPQEFKLRTISTNFNSPIGIDYHEPSGKVVMSVNYSTGGQPFNFEMVSADGTHSPFSNISGLTDELKLATVRDDGGGMGRGGFQVGELFTGSGVSGVVVRVSPDGSTVQNPWVTLPGEPGLMRGSLYVDRTGIFGGDLIVVTTAGGVWRINSAGQPTQLARIPTHLEGVCTIPDDPQKYGPWAGKILIGAENERRFYTVDAQGQTAFYDLFIWPEDIDIIPANENFFGVAFGNNALMGAPASAFRGMAGDLLITQESGALYHIRWNGSEFEKTILANVAQWEHVTFAPAGIVEIPPAGGAVMLNGSVTDDAAPGFPLSVSWEKVSGPGDVTFINPGQPVTEAIFNRPGTYVLRLTANDIEFTASDEVTINVTTPLPPLLDAKLELAPESAGPNVTGTSQTLRATLLDRRGFPLTGAPVHFIVNGANATSGDVSTNALGVAEFTYTGNTSGSDTVRATAGDGTLSVGSNLAKVSWVTPTQAISTTTVTGRFFHSNGSGAFTTLPTQQPAFTQFFPTINFNPPAGTVPGNTSGVGVHTHPFTNVTTDASGNFTGTIVAEGNGLQAGVGSLFDFHAVFTGTFTVAQPGPITFNFFSDDGFIFGVGGGAERVGGALSNPPPSGRTPFENFPVMGAFNQPTSPVANSVTVFFPAAGSYPYEVDYAECCGGELALTMTRAASGGSKGVPPTGSLALTPNTPAPRDAGQPQTFTVTATDASGDPMTDALLRLTISGANARQLTALTDATGRASFTYAGAQVGTDSLQVSTPVGATIAYSNVVSMRWNVPNQTPVVNAGSDLTLASVSDGAPLGGSVTDDGLPLGSRVTVQWTKVSGPGAVTFANPGAAATTATFAVAGVYLLRLTASDSQLSASDDVMVTVNGINQPPTVNAGVDQTITLPNTARLNGTAEDDGLPAAATLALTWSKVSGPGNVTFQNPNASATLASFDIEGTYVLRLSASDTEMTASDEVTVTVNAAVPPPVAQLASPLDGSNLTERTNIVGSVSGGTWRLEYSLNSRTPGQTWTTFAAGNAPVADGLLGTFDPTLLLNGTYTIRLVANGADGQTTVSTLSAVVTGELKVGIFTVAFTDLDVPVAGLPIMVSRTYDSRDKRTGDFGVGWWLGLRNVRVEKSRPLGSDWEQTVSGSFLPSYCLRPTKPSTVTITLPDGTVYAFAMTPNPQCQLLAPVQFTNISFNQLPGEPETQGATLTALGGENEAFFTGSAPGTGDLIDNDTADLYNPTRFRLTTADGTILIVDEQSGLQSLTDNNGNTLTISSGGVLHSSGKSITFTRDAQNRITRITDPAGRHIAYAYDLNGDLVSMTDQDGHVTRYTYNSSHHLLDIIDPLNRRGVRNEYDTSGRLTAITDEAGKTIRFSFNPNSRQQIVTDRKGNVTVYEFDERGKTLSITNAAGHVMRATYDGAGNRLTETDQFGNTTTYTYDARGNILTRTDAQNRVVRLTYDERNQVTSATDANGHTITNVYDAKGNLTSATDPLGNTISFTYDTSGQLLTSTDAAGHSSTFEYDASGNMTKTTDRLGHSTRYAYDAVGNITAATDARGNTTQFNFSDAGLLTSTVDALGNTKRNEYDTAGTLSTGIDELGRRTQFTSNFTGLPLQTTLADGTKFNVQYDANGNVASSSITGGLAPTVEHDRLNLPTKITVAPGVSMTLQYDAAGRRTAVSDPLGNTTTFQYNLLNKVTVEADALGNQTHLGYDAVGNLTTQTDPNGNTTAHTYDKANRLLRTTMPDGSFLENTYDALGQVTSTRDALGNVTAFTYDDEGQLLSVT
ncbi:MAG TPA: Ig-like domain-containing protein, partial [Pyrinomonadaceae bacterium]|nr:Ig-like domain-containing protein [Pyrinomonadaceae bacterium]